jgi:heat shock protein HslJ/phosphoglycolate phosphatase-like HAD superfamily hydrolase
MESKQSQKLIIAAVLLLVTAATVFAQADPLPSWNEGQSKKSIMDFVAKVTKPGSPDFVPEPERIATFDNDGTLWSEQPLYFQLLFGIDQVKALAPQHPEWKDQEPYKSVLAGDLKTAFAGGAKSLVAILGAGNTNITPDEYDQIVKKWAATAKHPKTGRLYTEMVFQPMLEVLAYLRANGFKTFITSGGGVDFMRAFSERVYGIPPEQVIGSVAEVKFEMRDGQPVLIRQPALSFFYDNVFKPVAIQRNIGRRPIAAFGNSDGDLQMLQWTCAGSGTRFCLYVHHTDGEREWAYENTPLAKFEKGLEEAKAKGWTVVDMKNEWKVIYPPQASSTVKPFPSGQRWRLREVNGMAVESTRAYLEFDPEAKRFSGDGGCNRIAGNFTLSGAQIRFAQVISTKRACLDGNIQKVESDLLKGLEEVTGFKIENGVLRLMTGDRTVLSFSADSKQ